MRKINQKGLALIKHYEGCKLTAYQDVGGIWTIGFGHTGSDVWPNGSITKDRANELLEEDIEKFYKLDEHISEVVNDNQYSALLCLAYNIGLSALLKSTLLKLVNVGESPDGEWTKWSHVNGKIINGLLARRVAELELYHEIG